MKIVRLRFDDGSEKLVSLLDPRVRRSRTSDDTVVGDLCRYFIDDQLVVAEVVEVADVYDGTADGTPNSSLIQQQIFHELVQLRQIITNNVVSNNNQQTSSSVQNSNQPEILELSPDVAITEPFPENDDREFTPVTGVVNESENNDGPNHSEDFRSVSPEKNFTQPSWKSSYGQIGYCFPPKAQIQVMDVRGDKVQLTSLGFDDLVIAFEAKWKCAKLPLIANKLDISFAFVHLCNPCLGAFSQTNAILFALPIGAYLFEMDVLRTAFLPGIISAFHKKESRPVAKKKKRSLNKEAQEAFYFLVNYFSTIVIDKRDSEHSLWHTVVRNAFNRSVNILMKKERRLCDGTPRLTTNQFLRYVIPGHKPIFNTSNAFLSA